MTKTLNLSGPDVELSLAIMIRLMDRTEQTDTTEPFKVTLEACLDLAASGTGPNQQTRLN